MASQTGVFYPAKRTLQPPTEGWRMSRQDDIYQTMKRLINEGLKVKEAAVQVSEALGLTANTVITSYYNARRGDSSAISKQRPSIRHTGSGIGSLERLAEQLTASLAGLREELEANAKGAQEWRRLKDRIR